METRSTPGNSDHARGDVLAGVRRYQGMIPYVPDWLERNKEAPAQDPSEQDPHTLQQKDRLETG
jgi:hypothetical protein